MEIVDTWLEEEQLLPRKQRHTGVRIFQRLQAEHAFTGGQRTVLSYVKQQKSRMALDRAKTYERLEHPPGEAQVDFTTIQVSRDQQLMTYKLFVRSSAYYLKNGHGDVIGLTNSSGTMLNQYTYDIWGYPLTAQETVENPFRYSGEYWDDSTGLQYLRARWYDPSIGRFMNEDTYEGELTNPLTLNLYAYTANNPLKYIDPSGHTYTWALNLISKGYNRDYYNSADASLAIFGASSLTFLAPDMSDKHIGTSAFRELFVPFHEIAQINVAKALYDKYGEDPTLEKKLYSDERNWLGVRKSYEADIVLGTQVWEVKPSGGKDPKPQLELYKSIGGLTEGKMLDSITGIVVFDFVKMRIDFPNPGEAMYSLYVENSDGTIRNLSTIGAAIAVANALMSKFPGGRRFAPAF